MMTLTERSVGGSADYQRLADFLNLCEAATYREYFFTAEELAHDATHPSFDPVGDRRLWEDATGQLVGVASLWGAKEPIDGFLNRHLSLRVHPNWRSQIEPDMLRWGETRLLQIGQARNLPTKLYVHCRDTEGDRLSLVARNGFEYERRFLTEVRSLLDPISSVQLPDGFQIINNTRRVPAQDWVDLYNQTFIDHWGFHPLTVEVYEHWLAEADYRPDLDLMAVAPDGTLAGFCSCYISTHTNAHFDRREGWISSLGTRRGFRRQGLGRSLLLTGLHQLKAEGMDTALLGVDTQNPNAAYDLYHAVGFVPQFAWMSYAKVTG